MGPVPTSPSTSIPRILWLETGDLYTIRRGLQAGPAHGVCVEHLEMASLRFEADEHGARIMHDGEDIVSRYDAVIVRTFAPYVSEALTVARLFAKTGKVVVDRSLVDEGYAMGKMHDALRLAAAGIAVPRTVQPPTIDEALQCAATMGYPCVLKSTFGACGKQVFLIQNEHELRARYATEPLGHWLVQEYLPAESDERVMVVGGTALPLFVRRTPAVGDFRTNFDHDAAIEALPLATRPDLKALAEQAASVLRREFTGVDIRARRGQPVILEANRRPGFQAFEAATGLDAAGTLLEYVKSRCQA